MLSKLSFGSFLVYAPRGTTDRAHRAQAFVKLDLKQDRFLPAAETVTSAYIANRMAETLDRHDPLRKLLAQDAVLVPVPRRVPLNPRGRGPSLWPSLRIAEALLQAGFGKRVEPLLERTEAIEQSSLGFKASNRPSPQRHFETVACRGIIVPPVRVVLVDDVITRGSTMLGCASSLALVFPGTQVAGFAVVRTMSEWNDVPNMVDPCVGTIHQEGDLVMRSP